MAVSAVGTRVWMVLMARFWSYRRSALFCVEQLVFNFRFPISGGRGIVAINCICNSQPALIVAIKPANNYFPAHSGCAVLPVTVLRILGQLEANNAIISWGNGYIYNKWSTMKPSKHHQIQKQWRRKAVQAEDPVFQLPPGWTLCDPTYSRHTPRYCHHHLSRLCCVSVVRCWLQWLQWSLVLASRNVVGGEARLRTTHLVIKCRPVTHRVAALQSIQIFLYKYTNIFMVLNENLSACLELVTALERNFDWDKISCRQSINNASCQERRGGEAGTVWLNSP